MAAAEHTTASYRYNLPFTLELGVVILQLCQQVRVSIPKVQTRYNLEAAYMESQASLSRASRSQSAPVPISSPRPSQNSSQKRNSGELQPTGQRCWLCCAVLAALS